MTLIPLGAQLGPVDLPPPPPSADPREPSPTAIRGRGSRTPQRARSPAPGQGQGQNSRGPSPSRPPVPHHGSSESSVQLVQPVPKPLGGLTASPINPFNPLAHHSAAHLSRPSSPSSIHSSSSAIFERDIELPAVASLSLNPNMQQQHTLNHKPSRLAHLPHGSALDHSIPAALDDAVEALAGTDGVPRGIEGLEIEAPAPSGGIGMARQSSASLHGGRPRNVSSGPGPAPGGTAILNSRSPSPVSMASRNSSGVASPAQSPPIMGQLAAQQAQGQYIGNGNTSPTSLLGGPRPPMAQRISTGPQVPGGWAFGTAAQPQQGGQDGIAEKSAGEGLKREVQPNEEIPPTPGSPAKGSSPPPAIPSHLTPTKDKRRISFISYNDLLLSVPTQVIPVGEIASGVQSPEHLHGTVSPGVNTRSPVISPPHLNGVGPKEVEHRPSWDAGQGGRLGGLGLGDGEWGREGLGRGLEQRLEELSKEDSSQTQSSISSPSV